MVSSKVKVFILITVFTSTFSTFQSYTDAVKIEGSDNKCSVGSLARHLPHETDCSFFYVCLHGKAVLKKCPSNLMFNKHSSVCDHPQNVNCQQDSEDKLGREAAEECPKENPKQPVLLPNKKDCGKFYICDAGVPHLKSCQPGLHFNPALQICDYPENAGCDSGVIKKGREGNNDLENLCPLNEDGNPMLKPHETDCRKFYTCSNGITLVHVCQQGLHFNAQLQQCDYPENAGCEKGITKVPKGKLGKEIPEQNCPLGQDGNSLLTPHETDCRKFYTCNHGVPELMTCQPGLHFNSNSQSCDYPENAGCQTGVSKKGRDGFNEICPLNEDGSPKLRPHETDCRKFYTCNNGIVLVHFCQHGLHFNAKLQQCDYPENAGCEKGIPKKEPKNKMIGDDDSNGCSSVSTEKTVLLPHPSECSKFIVCSYGVSHQKSCPSGLHFSTRLQACDYPSNVQCGKMGILRSVGVSSPYCPKVTGKISIFYRHLSNCSVYYLCNHGLAYEFKCPAKLHFNLRKKCCDYEVNARCSSTGSSIKDD